MDGPQITINYSPQLDLRIKCVKAQRYRQAGGVDYQFEVKCRPPHPSGMFEYSASDVHFDLDSWTSFLKDLRGLHHGTGNLAVLQSVSEIELRLELISRKLVADLRIREFIAPHMAILTSRFELDYDLFINKLMHETERFVDELRCLEPDEVG
jgi:hypothetical protein